MTRLNFIKGLFVFLLLMTIINANAGNVERKTNEKTVKVLTIGNSFADNACTYLKQITESVEGCRVVIRKANIGGCDLGKHANLIKKCEKNYKTLSKRYKAPILISEMHLSISG